MKAIEACTVHGAGPSDLPELMRLLRAMHAESGLMPLDESYAADVFTGALSRKEGIVGVIRGEGSEIRAAMFLLITRYWYTSKFHLEELFNFIDKPWRKSNYADALIRYAQHSAKQLGIPLVIGVLTNNRMEAKVRLYRRRLGMPAGAVFIDNSDYLDRATTDDLWRAHTRGRRVKQSLAENGSGH